MRHNPLREGLWGALVLAALLAGCECAPSEAGVRTAELEATGPVPADGARAGLVTIRLLEDGAPLPGVTVLLVSDRGPVDTIEQPPAPTDAGGSAVARVTSTTPGVATLSLIADGRRLDASTTLEFLPLGECIAEAQEACYGGPEGTQGVGVCRPGTRTCGAAGTWGACEDEVRPAATDAGPCNGLDDDCDGAIDEDADPASPDSCGGCEGVCPSPPNAGRVCDAGTCRMGPCDPGYHDLNKRPEDGCEYACDGDPLADEACDGTDTDCDGEIDEGFDADGDGYTSCGTGLAGGLYPARVDCDDLNAAVHPGAAEVCNGVDDDCDGATDQGAVPPEGLCPAAGVCAGAPVVCRGAEGWACALPDTYVAEEGATHCDGLDNDCDGATDEVVCACEEGETRPCGSEVGECTAGLQLCLGGSWGLCSGRSPMPETCDGRDEDCDGVPDDGFDADGDGYTTCGTLAAGGVDPLRVDCDDGRADVHPGATEVCNGVDDDCDGLTDEGADAACHDGLWCNGAERCEAGACVPGAAPDCSGQADACNAGVCDEALGACRPEPVADGAPCSDGAWCTVSDACTGGVCLGTARTCTTTTACRMPRCDEAVDACTSDPAPDGAPCDDGQFCTTDEVCTAGACGGTPRDCSGVGDACNDGICDEPGDACRPRAKADGTSCDDGLYCTTSDLCSAGTCTGRARDCGLAGDACNAGVCDEAAGSCLAVPLADGTACDDADACTGPDVCEAGTCRSSAADCSALTDGCHVGLCDPVTGTCRAEAAADGTTCDDGDPCTEGDTCTSGSCAGGPKACDAVAGACQTGVCNAATGACEAQPLPDGMACSDGLFCTVGDTCTAGACTGAERSCAGTGDACNAGVCDEAAGACVKQARPDGTSCEDGVFCTVGDTCSAGACGGLPRDCSASADQCNAGACDEAAGRCVRSPVADGTACEDGAFCTEADTCTAGTCGGQPRDCAGVADACNAGVCNESSDACDQAPRVDGTPCDDGAFCTQGDACAAGVCGGRARDCAAAGDACNAGVCDEGAGACAKAPKADGTACEDGAYCTVGDACVSGSCAGGTARDCSASGGSCRTGTCDEDADLCTGEPVADGTSCSDGLYCTELDACAAGTCQGSPRDCSALADACNDAQCSEALGACERLPYTDGRPCDDARFCTVGEVCTEGACGGLPRDCSAAGDPCNDGVCNEGAAACEARPKADGTGCDDGARCTQGDVCTAGACGGQALDCSALAGPCEAGVCDEATGTCTTVPVADGTACDDGRFCTVGDVCTAGACGGPGRDCTSLSDACNDGVCDEAGGACVKSPVPDGRSCEDGAFCTTGDVCQGGTCAAGGPLDCSALGGECTTGTCDEASDACVAQQKPNNTACEDGAYCTTGDFCRNGNCRSGGARDCSVVADGCNGGTCSEENDRCEKVPVADGTACDDGAFCTDGDLCQAGACTPGPGRDCSALADACNAGVCDEATNLCARLALADGTACEDGSYCTVGDACAAGSCTSGALRDCSLLDDACNLGACSEAAGACQSAPRADGTVCSDGAWCTESDVCTGGACAGTVRDCSGAADACNAGGCDEVADACVPTPLGDGTACEDGAFCTVGEQCTAGVCSGGAARSCDHLSDACNTGVCNEVGDTCERVPAAEGTACDDGSFCTTGETCVAGLCEGGTPRDCDDADPCTLDLCSAASGACEHPARAVDPASSLALSSTCLTLGAGGRATVFLDLRDAQGLPITGAAVAFSVAGDPVGGWLDPATQASLAQPGVYHRTFQAPAGGTASEVSALVTFCGNSQSFGPLTVTYRAPNTGVGGTGGCAPADGNLRVQVLQAEDDAPLAGAHVLVGSASGTPFHQDVEGFLAGAAPTGANTAVTDGAGYATFTDLGPLLDGPLLVTAGEPAGAAVARAYFTFDGVRAGDLVMPLQPTRPVTPMVAFAGTASSFNQTSSTGDLQVGLVLPQLDLRSASSLDLSTLLQPSRCVTTPTGDTAMPSNFYVPQQCVARLFVCVASVPQAPWALTFPQNHRVEMIMGTMSPREGTCWETSDQLANVHLEPAYNAELGFIPSSATGSDNPSASVALDFAYPRTLTVSPAGLPFKTDLMGSVFGDYAGGDGTGPLALEGIKVRLYDQATGDLAVPFAASGTANVPTSPDPGAIRYLAGLTALYLDSPTARPAADRPPATTEEGSSTVLWRRAAGGGAPLSGAADAVWSPSSFLGIAKVAAGGKSFYWDDVTANGTQPHFSVHELFRETAWIHGPTDPTLACSLERGEARTERDLYWEVWRPFGAACQGTTGDETAPGPKECFTLPTLPPGWPRAGEGAGKDDGFGARRGSGAACLADADCTLAGDRCIDLGQDDVDATRAKTCALQTHKYCLADSDCSACLAGDTCTVPALICAANDGTTDFTQVYRWRLRVEHLGLASAFDFDAFQLGERDLLLTHESSNLFEVSR